MRQRRPSPKSNKSNNRSYRAHRGNNRSHNSSYKGESPRGEHPQSGKAILPPPSIIQEYEYATEGAADRLLALAEAEQRRRHQWEDDYLKYYKKSLRIGQLLGTLVLLVAVVGVVVLALNGQENVATTLASFAFGTAILSNLMLSVKKRHPKRPKNRQLRELRNHSKKNFERSSNDNSTKEVEERRPEVA